MPRKRNYGRSKRYFKKIKKVVKNELHKQVENKFLELGTNNEAIYSNSGTAGAGSFYLLNGLQQGTAHGQRVGNRTRLMNLHVSGRIIGPGGLNADHTICRVIVFKWKTCNAGTPIISQLLSNLDVNNLDCTYAIYNRNYVPTDIQILYDKRFSLQLNNGPAITAGSVTEKKEFHTRKINLRGVLCNYNNGNTGTAADITMNSVWLYVGTDQVSAGGRATDFSWNTVLEYEDA